MKRKLKTLDRSPLFLGRGCRQCAPSHSGLLQVSSHQHHFLHTPKRKLPGATPSFLDVPCPFTFPNICYGLSSISEMLLSPNLRKVTFMTTLRLCRMFSAWRPPKPLEFPEARRCLSLRIPIDDIRIYANEVTQGGPRWLREGLSPQRPVWRGWGYCPLMVPGCSGMGVLAIQL